MSIGHLTVETDGAELWNPKPEWRRLDSALVLNLPRLQPIQRELITPLNLLLSGIVEDNKSQVHSGAYRLAGLGQGLTPAGDDVLMGLLYGLWVWRLDRDLMQLIVETAVPRTTTLSGAFLWAAMEGEASIHWHNLIYNGLQAVDQILSIGATSGRDAWTGFTHLGHRLAGKLPN